MLKEYLEAGKIVGTFGVLGEVRILPWSDSPDFLRGFSRVFIDGKEYKVKVKDFVFLVEIDDLPGRSRLEDLGPVKSLIHVRESE